MKKRTVAASILLIAAMLLFRALSAELAEEPPVNKSDSGIIAYEEIPLHEWDIVNFKAEYIFEDDSLFHQIERLSKTKPIYGPGVGVGSFGDIWAYGIVRSKDTQQAPRQYYNVNLQNVEVSNKERGVHYEVKVFLLENCVVNGDTTSVRGIGWYDSAEILNKLKNEILRRSQKIDQAEQNKKSVTTRVPKRTVPDFGVIIDEGLYRDIEGILKTVPKNSEASQESKDVPWAWISLYPRMDRLQVMQAPGSKIYRIGVCRNGRMNVFEHTGNFSDSSIRDLGWYESAGVWNRLRRKIVQFSAGIRAMDQKSTGK